MQVRESNNENPNLRMKLYVYTNIAINFELVVVISKSLLRNIIHMLLFIGALGAYAASRFNNDFLTLPSAGKRSQDKTSIPDVLLEVKNMFTS